MEALTTKDYLKMDLLRFTTAGSVDDGKSTLIGRLLYDSKSIFEDQIEAVERTSQEAGHEHVNLALVTDGLRAEREQGITIDVAYRYFATPKRKFIIADTPGHIQYTRNMVTGASTANLAIILIDARKGVIEQTRRHTYIASLLNIKHLVVCVNKMDLIDYEEDKFNHIKDSFETFAAKFDVSDVHFIPISALHGDNVVDSSSNMPWYKEGTLLHNLENVHIASDHDFTHGRFAVQRVIRPQSKEHHDFRGFAGRVGGGTFNPGDEIVSLPSGTTSKIKTIETMDGPLQEAFAPMSVVMTLDDEIDISRGNMIVKANQIPNITQDITLMVCWLNNKPLAMGNKYVLKHTTNEVRCVVKEIDFKMDISDIKKIDDAQTLELNDIGCIKLKTANPIFSDAYKINKITGSVIFIDEFTHETIGAGMIV